jgi:hypothetical protein
MAKSLCCKPLAILIIEESYLQRFFHTLNTSNDFGNNSNAWIAQFAISTDTNDKVIYFRRNINYTPTTWESWNRLVAS